MSPPPRLGYVPALDGLRGIAVALVVATHAYGLPYGGGLGVDLFFVLSGFLITSLLLGERAETGRVSVVAFYVRRARRLFPALAVVLAVYVAIEAARGVDALGIVARFGLYGGNAYQAFATDAYAPRQGLEHLWSLAEEEQFYLCWPLALVLLGRVRRPLAWLAALGAALLAYRVGLAFAGATHQRIYMGPDTHADGLILGSGLAIYRVRTASLRVREGLVTASVVFVGVAVMLRPTNVWWDAVGLLVFCAAGAVLVAAAVTETELARGLAARPLVWLGGISYSLYLWHFVLLWAFGWRHVLPVVALSVAVAWASTRWVERPFRRRRRSEQDLRSEFAAAAVLE